MTKLNQHKKLWNMAAALLLIVAAAAIIFYAAGHGRLILSNASTGKVYAEYTVGDGDTFSVGFVHSVNKSPLIDYYTLKPDGIYVEKTVYYGFGAGVQTELEDGQTLEYGDDGSMIVSGFDKRMDNLIYFVGTVSDHTLTINDGEGISLRDLCGRNAEVRFSYKHFLRL